MLSKRSMQLIRLLPYSAVRLFAVLAILATSFSSSYAQSRRAEEGSATIQRDASAIAELKSYSQATSLATWKGLNAAGTITLSGSEEAFTTTIVMLPGNRQRIETDRAKGREVFVVNGSRGYKLSASDKTEPISPSMAAARFVSFDLPMEAVSTESKYSVADGGLVSVSDRELHKITIGTLLSPIDVIPGQPSRAITDCYFDPKTHLLLQTVSTIVLPGTNTHRYTRVTSYSGYKDIGQHLLPTVITESLDGVPTWALHLTTADFITLPSAELF